MSDCLGCMGTGWHPSGTRPWLIVCEWCCAYCEWQGDEAQATHRLAVLAWSALAEKETK